MPSKIFIPNLNNLLRRYLAGESEKKLSEEAGVNRCTFRQRLLKAGIKPRGRSEAETVKWSRMTSEQRAHQVKAAHNATEGRIPSFGELCRRATSREGSLRYNVAPEEIVLGGWLKELGMNIIHNFAIGPYNCDLGIGSITVEIWGGGWHPKLDEAERTKYILDSGFSILFISLDREHFPLTRAVTQYIISLLELHRRNPTARRQYWMIRGDGELIFKRVNNNDISLVPPFTRGRNPANGQYERVPR